MGIDVFIFEDYWDDGETGDFKLKMAYNLCKRKQTAVCTLVGGIVDNGYQ